MQTIFEKIGGTYRQEGDYLLPNIEPPESPQIGIWGQRRLQYLRTGKKVLYITILMGGTLQNHLEETDKSANGMDTAHEQYPQPGAGDRAEGVDLCMKQPKRNLSLSASEYRLMIYGLLHFRNKLIQQGRYADPVNELLIKLQHLRRRRYG